MLLAVSLSAVDGSRTKIFHHRAVGKLTLHPEVLHLTDDGLRLNIYKAEPGSPDETAHTLLSLGVRDRLGTSATRHGSPSAGNTAFASSGQQNCR